MPKRRSRWPGIIPGKVYWLNYLLLLLRLLQGFLGGGLLLGWAGVNWLLSQTSTASNTKSDANNTLNDNPSDREIEIGSDSEDDKEYKRISSELRAFDEILARKDEQRRNKQWEGRGRY